MFQRVLLWTPFKKLVGAFKGFLWEFSLNIMGVLQEFNGSFYGNSMTFVIEVLIIIIKSFIHDEKADKIS